MLVHAHTGTGTFLKVTRIKKVSFESVFSDRRLSRVFRADSDMSYFTQCPACLHLTTDFCTVWIVW